MANSTTVSLSNDFIKCECDGQQLHVVNRLSGRATTFAFPAFELDYEGHLLRGDDFTPHSVQQKEYELIFVRWLRGTDISATVRILLPPDRPWFYKSVTLSDPHPAGPPARLYVHVEDDPPSPLRRVGYGIRGGPQSEEIEGLDTYAHQPGCGYPVYAGDWFFGLEHPAGFTVPGERLEMYHHPTWSAEGTIQSFRAVFGAAESHEDVPERFMDYLWAIRNPRPKKPYVVITTGWTAHNVGPGEYDQTFEATHAFVDGLLEVGIKPDAVAMDAGWFERDSMYHAKDDDDADTRLIQLRKRLEDEGMDLALWVSHNGRTGFDMDWIKQQGWETGDGPGATYRSREFVVMMQPDFEEALAERFAELVGRVGAQHLKIDWDNECATNETFADEYPTSDHVREASLLAFNRIDGRIREANESLLTRNGWWPSPWWLQHADHVWLVNSGDCEYAMWPSRTQRDRDNTHRDACYYQITRNAETPMPLDAYDNHGFVDALDNPFSNPRHTWLDNLVLQFTRGTTYLHMPLTPENLRNWQARQVQQALDWWHYHGEELGTRHSRMVLGNPAYGEIYGFLHPFEGGAWLTLRNPSVEPQKTTLPLDRWLGYEPGTVRQVHPYWHDLDEPQVQLLGHEVCLLRAFEAPQEPVSPVQDAPFMVKSTGEGYEYLFPGSTRLSEAIRPTTNDLWLIEDLSAEKTTDGAIEGGHRLQWFVQVPHRFEKAELLTTLRGTEEVLDGVTVRGGNARYRTAPMRHYAPVERVFRREERAHGTERFLPPVGERTRDDYVFGIPDGGYVSVTVDVLGPGVEELDVDCWITGYQGPARQTISDEEPPMPGPLLPPHPYGFSRCLRVSNLPLSEG
ncbi:MAG: hypothetical protein R6V19_08320 [Armatimonadota bacterium]